MTQLTQLMKPVAEPKQKPSINKTKHSENESYNNGNFKEIRNISRNTETKDNLDRETTDSADLPKLKAGLSPSKKFFVISFIKSPLKMIKNVFYFVLKTLFVLKIFSFYHDFLAM